ncbi:MAG: HNH endonuclease [Halobacteriota archaeon]
MCGKEFHSEYEKKYCSEECLNTVPREGKHAANYQGASRETSCVLCGTSFEYYPSNKEGLYCSSCVENESWRTIPIVTGSDHPRWKGGKTTVKCDVCDVSIERYPSELQSEVIVCSRECQAEYFSEAYTGSDHPNWAGGSTGSYGPGWARVRRQALERDDYTCQHCGATAEELDRNPDVHHIVPVRAFIETPATTVQDAHYLENLISLCIACHRKAEFGKLSRSELERSIAC